MHSVGESPGSWRGRHNRIPPDLVETVHSDVLRLAASNPSPVSIARQLSASYRLSFSPGTFRHWMIGDRKIQRRNVFKSEPSPALSYIVGANIGDGSALKKSWIVKLEVTDLDFAQAFNVKAAELFSHASPNKIMVKRFQVNRLPMYVVRYRSKQLVQLLKSPLQDLLKIATAFPCEFLRGIFDAEGHVDVGVTKEFHLAVGADNSNRQLLLRVKQLLGDLGIESRIERKRKAGALMSIRGKSFIKRRDSYSVMIGRCADVKKFANEVGFSIHRKVQKLFDALSIIQSCEPRARPAEWKKLYGKVAGEWVRL
ncbi:MAG TPA: LAGLIDADG family homing endonuclease [Nitrososphaerales archaeon]|nr:LAGLIDADG family homing endonuclease [Nitrososphaerales archaeon]